MEDDQWHTVKLVIHKGQYSLYLDSSLIIDQAAYGNAEDNNVEASYLSLKAWEYAGSGSQFDNIHIYAPEGSGEVIVLKGGIWKSEDNELSLYVQKYEAGSCVMVVTMGDGKFTAFIDSDYSDGVSASDDLYRQGYTLQMNLTDESNGTITVTLPGIGQVTKAISLSFPDTL